MGVHPGGAELQVMAAMVPRQIVFALPATPSVVPRPPSRCVTDVVGRSDADSRQLVSGVCTEKVRHGVSRRLLPKAEVGYGKVVAVEVEGRLIQQSGTDGGGG